MFFREWKAVLPQAKPVAVERVGAVAADVAPVDGGLPCPRPEQAQKCFKLDYILWAQEAIAGPARALRRDPRERCRLCNEIIDAEPMVDWESPQRRVSQGSVERCAQ
jgi:hypothetical protein